MIRKKKKILLSVNENVLCFYTLRISSPRCVCALLDRSNRVRFALSFVYFARLTRRRPPPPRLRFVPFVTSPRFERIAGQISLLSSHPRGSICARDEEDPLLLFFPPPSPRDDRKFTTRRTQRERERESARDFVSIPSTDVNKLTFSINCSFLITKTSEKKAEIKRRVVL